MVDGIASRNFIRNAKCIRAGILHAHWVSADERSCRNPAIGLENASHFPSAQHPRRGPLQRGRHGNLPDRVEDRGMSEVEVRRRPADRRGEPEPGGDGIRESIAGNRRRIVVHRLAVGVIASELEAVAEPLLDIKLNRVITGAGVPHHPPDDQVEAMGAYITYRCGEGRGDLPLDVDIPLLDVIPLRIRFDIGGSERAISQRRRAARGVHWSEVRECTPWVVAWNAHFPRRSRGI